MKISLIALAAACAVASFAFAQFDLPPIVPPHAAVLDQPAAVLPHSA